MEVLLRGTCRFSLSKSATAAANAAAEAEKAATATEDSPRA